MFEKLAPVPRVIANFVVFAVLIIAAKYFGTWIGHHEIYTINWVWDGILIVVTTAIAVLGPDSAQRKENRARLAGKFKRA